MNPERLGAFIRSIRISKGMTQQALAEALHVTDKAVSKWERGLSLPDISLFTSLANVLNISTSDLLLECSDEQTPSHLVQIYEGVADIRTPLHIILGCTELLRKYRNHDELFERYLESIRISGEYLLAVAEKMPCRANSIICSASAASLPGQAPPMTSLGKESWSWRIWRSTGR